VLRDGSLYGKGFTFASASLGGAVHDQQLLTALLAAAVTVITTLLAWIGGRRKQSVEADKTQAETEQTVSQGFQLLVSKLQEERRELMRVIDEQSEEITALRGEVRALTRQVVKLENVITKAGLDVPNAGNA
jgi:peptidoglycan hydrolase CwlO-like protein